MDINYLVTPTAVTAEGGPVFDQWSDGQTHVLDGEIILSLSHAQIIYERQFAIEVINKYAKSVRMKIAGTDDLIEIAGWPNKAERARRILDDNGGGDIATQQLECDLRGKKETPEDLAKKQLANEAFFARAVAAIDGLKSKSLTLINAATTPEQVRDILSTMKTEAEQQFADLMK